MLLKHNRGLDASDLTCQAGVLHGCQDNTLHLGGCKSAEQKFEMDVITLRFSVEYRLV